MIPYKGAISTEHLLESKQYIILRMTEIWESIAAVGKLLTVLAVAPSIIGMAWLLITTDIRTADPVMLEPGVNLMVSAMLALIPLSLGGMALFALFEFAEAHA